MKFLITSMFVIASAFCSAQTINPKGGHITASTFTIAGITMSAATLDSVKNILEWLRAGANNDYQLSVISNGSGYKVNNDTLQIFPGKGIRFIRMNDGLYYIENGVLNKVIE